MPATMVLRMLGLGPKIGGSADSPVASARVWIENIDQVYNEDDVIKKVIEFVAPSIRFHVPNPTGTSAYEWTLLYVQSVLPEFISDHQAVASVEWGLVKAAPLAIADPSAPGGSKKPSETTPTTILGPEYSVEIQVGTKHITQSVKTRWRAKVGGTIIAADSDPDSSLTAPFLKRAIGVNKDGVQGCDIYTSDVKWSIKVKGIPVTHEYIDTLTEIAGKSNALPYFGRDREELVFLGCTLGYKPGDAWEGNYTFHQKKNRTAVEFVPGITFPEVRGHDYLWAGGYTKIVIGGFTVETPTTAYCEQVYETDLFEEIGI